MLPLRRIRHSARLRHDPFSRALAAIVLISTLHLLSPVAVAQEATGDVRVESDIDELLKAESDLTLLHSGQFVRNESNLQIAVERRLNGILQRDPNSPFRFQVEQDLISVGELLARKHLAIATFYLNRSRATGSGTKGAQGRLLEIARKYPRFSQMDEVLFKLAEISQRVECPDDAAAFLRKLISDYPLSSYLGPAFEKLNEIAIGDKVRIVTSEAK